MAAKEMVVLTLITSIEFVVGTALNLHIICVYIGNLKNGLSLGPSDRVHLTKALVNVCLHVSLVAQILLNTFWPQLFFIKEVFLWAIIVIMFLNFYSYWLTAVLCVYYCTNITTGGHHIFVWLKRSLSSYLLHILLVSGLGSLAISLPIFWFCSIESTRNNTNQFRVITAESVNNIPYRTTIAILGCFSPFTIAFVCTAFTSWSLLSHMWRMKKNNPGFTRSKFQTQINATRTMILFLLISFLYSAALMLLNSVTSGTSDVGVTIIWFIITSYPISEAAIIIQSSVKLRKILHGKIFDRKRRNREAET